MAFTTRLVVRAAAIAEKPNLSLSRATSLSPSGGDVKAFPRQLGNPFSPACPGSFPRWNTSPGRHPEDILTRCPSLLIWFSQCRGAASWMTKRLAVSPRDTPGTPCGGNWILFFQS
ncbi:uncharacterized protein LOC144034108 [Vanacampus margaritifer]